MPGQLRPEDCQPPAVWSCQPRGLRAAGFSPRPPASGRPATPPGGASRRNCCGRRWRTSATAQPMHLFSPQISQLDNCPDFFLFLCGLLGPLLKTFERAAAFLVESGCPELGMTPQCIHQCVFSKEGICEGNPAFPVPPQPGRRERPKGQTST
uniref:Uncharacterized protein n=1 Tax=Chrysemys picta bellii TaxID=8478 RepID=A0A8C3FB62_CHRPI